MFTALIDQRQCAGSEPAVQARLESLASQWETLVAKSAEKSEKLKEASRQQTYNAGVKDAEFWLGEVYVNLSHSMTKPTKWCAPSGVLDHPGHMPSLIRVFVASYMDS